VILVVLSKTRSSGLSWEKMGARKYSRVLMLYLSISTWNRVIEVHQLRKLRQNLSDPLDLVYCNGQDSVIL
jgi:hypothetical protein